MHVSARSKLLRRTVPAAVVAAAVVAVPVAVAGAPTTVSTTHNSKLGTILANAQGHALYEFSKGTACTGSCASTWHPLLGGAAAAKSGAKQSLVSLTTIAGGNKQVTYNHHVLYTYAGDKSSGQANGNGISSFGGKWYALNTSGNQAKSGGSCNPVCTGY